MMVDSRRQVEAERRASEEEEAQMESERQASVMKTDRQASAVELSFQITDWLQIYFRFISDWQYEKSLKPQIPDWFRLDQIDSSDFRLDFQISD